MCFENLSSFFSSQAMFFFFSIESTQVCCSCHGHGVNWDQRKCTVSFEVIQICGFIFFFPWELTQLLFFAQGNRKKKSVNKAEHF